MKKIIDLERFEEIEVQWNNKCCVDNEHPFRVTWNKDSEIVILNNVKIIRVHTEVYNNIADKLDDLKEGIQCVVITDNIRYLAINTGGYKYPRYKSAVCYEGQILPF